MKKILLYCTLIFSSTISISILLLTYTIGTVNNDVIPWFLFLFIIELIISLILAVLELRKK